MALDEVRQRLFWWDRTQSAIYQTGLSGIDPKILIKGVHGNSFAVKCLPSNYIFGVTI